MNFVYQDFYNPFAGCDIIEWTIHQVSNADNLEPYQLYVKNLNPTISREIVFQI